MAFKILPLGDSITYGVIQGSTETGGYRSELFNLFAADNFSVDFVGSLSNGPNDIDIEHEGHRGWRIDQIAASVNEWLNTYQPDVVQLMIGTNDILQDYALSTAPDRLSGLIDQITNLLPNSNVLVASIPPISSSTIDQQQAIWFNSSLPEIVDSKVSQGKKVSFVDIFSQLTFSDLSDGVHPSAEGYNKIAAAWHDALLPLTNIKPSIRVQAEDMSLTNYHVESGNYSALGQELISLYQAPSPTGTASLQFTGPEGTYDVVVGYFDENDGQSQLSVRLGGQLVDRWTLNQNLDRGWATPETRVSRTIATGQTLNQGTTIEIQGTLNQAEFARVDYIEFIPVTANSTPGMINGTEAILNGSAGDDTLISGVGKDSLYGGVAWDMFVLSPQQGTDTITDFVDGQDRLGLSGGLRFDQLTITQGTNANVNDTLIGLTNTGELLAKLSGVQASTITSADFT